MIALAYSEWKYQNIVTLSYHFLLCMT